MVFTTLYNGSLSWTIQPSLGSYNSQLKHFLLHADYRRKHKNKQFVVLCVEANDEW